MITYVNTVLVANKGNQLAQYVAGSATLSNVQGDAGKIAFMNLDIVNGTPGTAGNPFNQASVYAVPQSGTVHRFKVGVVTDKYITKTKNNAPYYIPVVKWSNEIKTADIKNIATLNHPGKDGEEDKIVIDFTANAAGVLTANSAGTMLSTRGGFPIVLRLTFKDTPTRYRNWSESYDYFVNPGDSPADVAAGLAEAINGQSRRARVIATPNAPKSGALTLEAMPYDDNESKDSENFNAKVRFNANVWYSDPMAPGFASSNKYALGEIKKIAGWEYAASAKNVRDHERTAQGYLGIMHRGCWYDPKPTMAVDMSASYGAITLEFENMYRAADDIFRKTKQTVEIYATNGTTAVDASAIGGGILSKISTWAENETNGVIVNNTTSYASNPDAATPAADPNQ